MRKIFFLGVLGMVATFQLFSQEQIQTLPVKWSLSQCIGYATEHSISVQQANLTQTTTELTYEQSKFERFPSLSASASQSMTNGTSIDPITSDFVNQLIQSSSFGLTSQVTLYNGNKINNQIKQNALYVAQNSLYVQEAKNSIVLSLVEAYLRTEYYRESIRTAENTVLSTKKQLDQLLAKQSFGVVAPKAIADMQAQLASNQYDVITATNAYDQQVLVVKQLLELDPGKAFELESLPENVSYVALIPEKETVYQQALEKMPEVQASGLQSQIKEYDLSMAKAGYRPTVSLSATMASGYTNTQDLMFADQLRTNFNQRLSLSVSVPIFSKYQNKTKVEKAKIEIRNAALTEQTTQKELYKKIETAWQNARAAQSELLSAQATLDAAKVAYDLAQQQFEKGVIDPVSLVQSQNTYLNAQQRFLQAKYMGILYQQLLQFYQGNEIKI